jgi:hypothetical protein
MEVNKLRISSSSFLAGINIETKSSCCLVEPVSFGLEMKLNRVTTKRNTKKKKIE